MAAAPLHVIVPLDAAVFAFECEGVDAVIDRGSVALAPSGFASRLSALGASGRVLVATILPALVKRVSARYAKVGLSTRAILSALSSPRVLSRTTWVHEVVHRLLFERQVCAGTDNEATRFLETELVKELCFLAREADAGEDRAPRTHELDDLVERARQRIARDLFSPCDIAALAAGVGASESTLLRAFKREVGMTPGAYWRVRRLEEALALLESGRLSVSEVAFRVGYESPTAFTDAFRKHFGRAPSSFR